MKNLQFTKFTWCKPWIIILIFCFISVVGYAETCIIPGKGSSAMVVSTVQTQGTNLCFSAEYFETSGTLSQPAVFELLTVRPGTMDQLMVFHRFGNEWLVIGCWHPEDGSSDYLRMFSYSGGSILSEQAIDIWPTKNTIHQIQQFRLHHATLSALWFEIVTSNGLWIAYLSSTNELKVEMIADSRLSLNSGTRVWTGSESAMMWVNSLPDNQVELIGVCEQGGSFSVLRTQKSGRFLHFRGNDSDAGVLLKSNESIMAFGVDKNGWFNQTVEIPSTLTNSDLSRILAVPQQSDVIVLQAELTIDAPFWLNPQKLIIPDGASWFEGSVSAQATLICIQQNGRSWVAGKLGQQLYIVETVAQFECIVFSGKDLSIDDQLSFTIIDNVGNVRSFNVEGIERYQFALSPIAGKMSEISFVALVRGLSRCGDATARTAFVQEIASAECLSMEPESPVCLIFGKGELKVFQP